MRVLTGLCLALCITGTVMAQSIDFEPASGYTPGLLIPVNGSPQTGQDSWTCCIVGSDSSGFVVATDQVSPIAGSTQSLKVFGVNSGNRVGRPLATPISNGVYRFGWDVRHTGGTVFQTIILYTASNAQVLQAYFDGSNFGTWYNSGGSGSATYGQKDLFSGAPLDTWLRYEFILDFDNHVMMDFNLYNISSGSKVLMAHNDGGLYTQWTGGAWVGPFAKWGVRLDSTAAAQVVWLDNMTVTPATLPSLAIVPFTPDPDKAAAGFEYIRKVSTDSYLPGNWTLINGPPGMTIDASGNIRGWTPSSAELGTSYTVTVQATYGASTAQESWQVNVSSPYADLDIAALTTPENGDFGTSLTTDGTNLYMFKKDNGALISSADNGQTWSTLASAVGTGSADNGGLAYWNGKLITRRRNAGGADVLCSYDIAGNTWTEHQSLAFGNTGYVVVGNYLFANSHAADTNQGGPTTRVDLNNLNAYICERSGIKGSLKGREPEWFSRVVQMTLSGGMIYGIKNDKSNGGLPKDGDRFYRFDPAAFVPNIWTGTPGVDALHLTWTTDKRTNATDLGLLPFEPGYGTAMAPLPANWNEAVGAQGGVLIIAGRAENNPNLEGWGSPSNKYAIYDIATGRYTLGLLPGTTGSGTSAVLHNNKIYIKRGGSPDAPFNNTLWAVSPCTAGPVIETVAAERAYAGATYQRQLTLASCGEATWSLVSGPTGLSVNSYTGLVSWLPPVAGQTYPVQVTATNSRGTATMSWTITVVEQPVADSGIAQPWGTIHGTAGGPQSTSHASMVLDDNWANGAKVDWTLDVSTLAPNIQRGAFRASITFDEVGNLYWKSYSTTDTYLVSLNPDGTLRWIGSYWGGAAVSLGAWDYSTPVVGDNGEDGRVYVLTDSGVAAFSKSDGTLVWSAVLPGVDYAGHTERPTPVLCNGKLYVVGFGTNPKKVYQINSTTGGLDWSSDVTGVGINPIGQMALVPNAFGVGVHGLYFNGDGGSGECVFGLSLNTASGAAKVWGGKGIKAARSHVIYVPLANRVCAHGWDDYGAGLGSWNLDGSNPSFATMGNDRSKHGYEDFGALDFNGTDIVCGNRAGNFARYSGIGASSAPDTEVVIYDSQGFENMTLGALDGQETWTASAAGTGIAPMVVDASTGNQVVGTKAVRLEVTDIQGDQSGLTFPIADLVAAGYREATISFDVYRQAPPAGMKAQNFWWWSEGTNPIYGLQWDSGSGLTLANGWNGSHSEVATVFGAFTTITLKYDLVNGAAWAWYNGVLVDNAIPMPNIVTFPNWHMHLAQEAGTGTGAAVLWIDNFKVTGKTGGVGNRIVPSWYQLNDLYGEMRGLGGLYRNESGKTIYIQASNADPSHLIFGVNLTDLTPYEAAMAPPQPIMPSMFEFNTGSNLLRCGPVLGPVMPGGKQHLYFFTSDTELVALTYKRPVPGDCSTDGTTFGRDDDVDGQDLLFFQNCSTLAGPSIPVTPGCECADLEPDNDVDQADFGLFQRCFLLPAPVSADCAN